MNERYGGELANWCGEDPKLSTADVLNKFQKGVDPKCFVDGTIRDDKGASACEVSTEVVDLGDASTRAGEGLPPDPTAKDDVDRLVRECKANRFGSNMATYLASVGAMEPGVLKARGLKIDPACFAYFVKNDAFPNGQSKFHGKVESILAVRGSAYPSEMLGDNETLLPACSGTSNGLCRCPADQIAWDEKGVRSCNLDALKKYAYVAQRGDKLAKSEGDPISPKTGDLRRLFQVFTPVRDRRRAPNDANLYAARIDPWGNTPASSLDRSRECAIPLPGFEQYWCQPEAYLKGKTMKGLWVMEGSPAYPEKPLYVQAVPLAAERVACNYQEYEHAVAILSNRATGSTGEYIEDKATTDLECAVASDGTVPRPSKADITRIPKNPGCFRGELGQSFYRYIKALNAYELAQLSFQDAEASYKIRGSICARYEKDGIKRAANIDAYNEATSDLKNLSTGLQIASNLVKGCAGWKDWIATFGASCASAALSSGALLADLKVEKLGAKHQAFLDRLASEQQTFVCQKELEQTAIQLVTQRKAADAQIVEMTSASAAFLNAMRTAQRAASDGNNELARLRSQPQTAYYHSYWYDEKADRFVREFRWAKRLTYLTMRAVEFEFQQTLNLRSTIARATHPDQLEASLRAMQREVATRAINRRRPEAQSIVLSLRDDILGLQNRSDVPASVRPMSSIDALQAQLQDPRNAIYNTNNEWVGQGIPFSLSAFGTLKNRCAERLWRVNATIQGDGLSERAPGAPVMLMKRNTFSSQWCDGLGNGADTQTASVLPSQNLFRERRSPTNPGEASQFSASSLFPWFNVRRADFYQDNYTNGGSEELAGRGLYGDYILLFSREMLVGERFPTPPQGEVGVVPPLTFPLHNVEDVLLRFDYLSVDNFPTLAASSAKAESKPSFTSTTDVTTISRTDR